MLTSPNANLFIEIMNRIKSQVSEIRFVAQDIGQLENYDIRPAVSWPCCLIDMDQTNFTEANDQNIQLAAGMITMRLGLVKYTDSNNLVPDAAMENSLQYYEIEQKLYQALQGWNPDGFGKMLRRVAATERRQDDIRVRTIRFEISYVDESARPVRTSISRPGAEVFTS